MIEEGGGGELCDVIFIKFNIAIWQRCEQQTLPTMVDDMCRVSCEFFFIKGEGRRAWFDFNT